MMAARLLTRTEPESPVWLSRECDIRGAGLMVRGEIRTGHAHDIQECYRTLAVECLRRGATSLLVIGKDSTDPAAHRALRDAVRSMSGVGVREGFRMAVVPPCPELAKVYAGALDEAAQRGIEARQFLEEADALEWLGSPPSAPRS